LEEIADLLKPIQLNAEQSQYLRERVRHLLSGTHPLTQVLLTFRSLIENKKGQPGWIALFNLH
jgi:hypothetical protein